MTSNQIALKESETKERGLKEQVRSNKAKERIEDRKLSEAKKKRIQDGILGTANIIAKVGPNDPSWYNQDAQLVRDAAAISFNNPLGGKFLSPILTKEKPNILPGIMSIYWMPSIGKCTTKGAASTADIAAKSLYAYVRYANSGARNYEASDLMMYLLAVGQAYSYYGFLSRLYSLALDTNPKNRYSINAMIQANGVDPDDLRANLANFRAYINTYATRLNSMYVPKDLPLFQRHMWMNTGIFKDQNLAKAQVYMYVQKEFLAYDDINGKLTTLPEGIDTTNQNVMFDKVGKNTFAQLRFRGDLLINQLVNSEDAGIMAGDILKAYGEGNMAYAASIPENFHIEPVYSLEVLSQIHNTILTGAGGYGLPSDLQFDYTTSSNLPYNHNLFDIGQVSVNMVSYLTQGISYTNSSSTSDNTITGYGVPTTMGMSYGNYATTAGRTLGSENFPINFYKDDVNPDDIMVASRLQPVVESDKYATVDGNKVNVGFVTDPGTEIAINAAIFTIDDSNPNKSTATSIYSSYLLMEGNANSGFTLAGGQGPVNTLCTISMFDWHPFIYPVVTDAVNEATVAGFRLKGYGFGVYANYTDLKNSVRSNLHYVAILSELGIPKLGLTVRTR